MTDTTGDTNYGLSHLGLGSIDVHLEFSSVEGTLDPAYFNGGNAVSSEFVQQEPMVDRIKGLT